MPYTTDISRTNPACILLLIDQSGSMTQPFAGQSGQRKMDQAADAINEILDNVAQRCSRGMDIRDYFHIGVIGYNTSSNGSPILTSVFPGTSTEQPFLPISRVVDIAQVVERRVQESDGAGGQVEVTRRVPVWLSPRAEFGTPMMRAFQVVFEALEAWISDHPDSFPPIVINVSDGMATDGDPGPDARRLMGLRTSDGNVLIFNIHLSEIPAAPVLYPDSENSLPRDDYAHLMFRMSSVLTEGCRMYAASIDVDTTENSRGYVFEANNMRTLTDFLEIGTRAASNLQ